MAGCKTDEDCSLLGVCESTWCLCDSGWTGDDCGEFESCQIECSMLGLASCTNRTQVSVKEPFCRAVGNACMALPHGHAATVSSTSQ
jgi:hypothetical protein